MKISRESHLGRSWTVDKIASDFNLWDVWEIPISATNSGNQNFQSFYLVALESFDRQQRRASLTAFLFALRYWLSRVFPMDRNINTLPIPGCNETSVKDRLSSEDLEKSKQGYTVQEKKTKLEFRPVYLFENEGLHELSNDTVHALVHIGWIRKQENDYTATLAIYVKPRGMYGKLYLKLIEPFRHHIVYPAMMKAMKEGWERKLTCCSFSGRQCHL